METVSRKLVGRDVIPDVPGLCALRQQVSDEAVEVPLRSGDVLTAMQEGHEFGAVVLVRNECKGFEYRFEPFKGFAGSIADLGEMLDVAGDLSFMPCDHDRLDV
jgi:hypothetical protein